METRPKKLINRDTTTVTIQQGEILLHYDMIAVKSHVERQRWCFQTAEILEWPSALGEDRWYSISAKGL